MKLIAQVQLQPSSDQAASLRQTLERANAACNWLSGEAWRIQLFGKWALQREFYLELRRRFDLTAQMVIRVIAKVADAYRLDKKSKRTFKVTGSIAYDDRILRWYVEKEFVSIWSLDGRLKIPFACGPKQKDLLKSRQGESDLILFRGKWYLSATCEIEAPEPFAPHGVLGIDLGVVNLATTSDGAIISGKAVKQVRYRHRRLRTKLQRLGTKAAKRKLKALSGKERQFAKDTNHVVAKRIVANAQDTQRAIALEDLTGIRTRMTVKRAQRATLHSWSFFQLQAFISYKARREGVPVLFVDPRNSSRVCPACGTVDKRNRPTQAQFKCVSCGLAGHADTLAAREIARRAGVMLPNVSRSHRSIVREGQGQATPL